MHVRKINNPEEAPISLLLVADPSKKAVHDYINRGICFVLEVEKEIRGVFVLLPTRPYIIECVNIAVEERYQNKGLGKLMLTEAINIAKSNGYQTMEIGTGNSSIGQLALYQKCGFRITGVDRDFFIRHYDEEIYENGIHCRDMIRLSKDL